MTPRNVKYTRQPAPFRCYKCGRTDTLHVGNDVVKRSRKRRGDPHPRLYDHVPVDCRGAKGCGHQFYSMHPDAIARSRKADVNLGRRHKKAS